MLYYTCQLRLFWHRLIHPKISSHSLILPEIWHKVDGCVLLQCRYVFAEMTKCDLCGANEICATLSDGEKTCICKSGYTKSPAGCLGEFVRWNWYIRLFGFPHSYTYCIFCLFYAAPAIPIVHLFHHKLDLSSLWYGGDKSLSFWIFELSTCFEWWDKSVSLLQVQISFSYANHDIALVSRVELILDHVLSVSSSPFHCCTKPLFCDRVDWLTVTRSWGRTIKQLLRACRGQTIERTIRFTSQNFTQYSESCIDKKILLFMADWSISLSWQALSGGMSRQADWSICFAPGPSHTLYVSVRY